MMSILMKIVLIQAVAVQLADSYLEINASNSCGKVYNMGAIEEAYIRYSGEKLLGHCVIEFDNNNEMNEICIVTERMKLSCYSRVKYYTNIESDLLDAQKLFTCKDTHFDEWCGKAWKIFVVMDSHYASDRIVLHVKYVTHVPVLVIALAIAVPIVVLIIVCVVYCKCKHEHQRKHNMTGHKNVVGVQPTAGQYRLSTQTNTRGFQSYPVGSHDPVTLGVNAKIRVDQSNVPLQKYHNMKKNRGQFKPHSSSQFQPFQETRFGPNIPSVSHQIQMPTPPMIVTPSTTLGPSNYQPLLLPSGAPPSYADATDSRYYNSMDDYKTDWHSKP